MGIVDVLIIVILIIGAYRGWKYGFISSAVYLIGTLLIFILAFYLKNPLSALLYENLPFRSYGGIFSGITSINILVYECVSYLICIIILSVILKVILKLTGVLDKLINLTLIFALPSKILGLVFGALEYYIYLFVVLFVVAQIPTTAAYVHDSDMATGMISSTPLLSNVTNDLYNSVKEVYDIGDIYSGASDKSQADYEALEVLLKYDIITPSSVERLVDKGKLKIDNVEELIDKYEEKQ